MGAKGRSTSKIGNYWMSWLPCSTQIKSIKKHELKYIRSWTALHISYSTLVDSFILKATYAWARSMIESRLRKCARLLRFCTLYAKYNIFLLSYSSGPKIVHCRGMCAIYDLMSPMRWYARYWRRRRDCWRMERAGKNELYNNKRINGNPTPW